MMGTEHFVGVYIYDDDDDVNGLLGVSEEV